MKRLLNTIPLFFLMFFALVGTAAAQTSWLPTYNAGQTVYIAPGVDASFESTYATQAFKTEIGNAARVHNLDVYVIITASSDDAGSDAHQAGPVLVRNLWTRWTADVAFNSERAVIVLMTGDGHTLTSVGVRAGGYLNNLGIMRATMNDPNGPVMPVLRSYLASDPATVPVRIVNNLNAIVTSKVYPPANLGGGNQPTSGTTEGDNSMGIGTLLLIIAGGAIFVAVIARLIFPPRRPTSTYTPPARPTPRPTLRKTGSGFEGRLSDSRRNRAGGTAGGVDAPDTDDMRRRKDDGINTAAAAGAGVVAGVLLSEATRRNDDEPRRDSGSSDSGYVPPVVSTPSCSTPSSSPSCSSSSGSSCSSSSGSSCGGGGGSSCGGGGGM
jgi:uncharacterized membrane protein YgcG